MKFDMATHPPTHYNGGFGQTQKNASDYFTSATGGWIDYSDNLLLVKLFSHALVSTAGGHEKALEILRADIQSQKDKSNLRDRKAK